MGLAGRSRRSLLQPEPRSPASVCDEAVTAHGAGGASARAVAWKKAKEATVASRTARERPPASRLDVSVVLPVFNEKGHLSEEIRRIRAALESSQYSFEIIVVDDGSTDGSGEALH